jgi:hypothetical protein
LRFLSPDHLRRHHEREVTRRDSEESMYERLQRERREESNRDSLVADLLAGKPFAALQASDEIWELAAKHLAGMERASRMSAEIVSLDRQIHVRAGSIIIGIIVATAVFIFIISGLIG